MSGNRITARQSSNNLNFSTAQKMIHRLLTHDRIKTELDEGRIRGFRLYNEPEIKIAPFTKEELAEKLGISPEELEQLKSPEFYNEIVNKISLSLIRLYCATKFADGESNKLDWD